MDPPDLEDARPALRAKLAEWRKAAPPESQAVRIPPPRELADGERPGPQPHNGGVTPGYADPLALAVGDLATWVARIEAELRAALARVAKLERENYELAQWCRELELRQDATARETTERRNGTAGASQRGPAAGTGHPAGAAGPAAGRDAG